MGEIENSEPSGDPPDRSAAVRRRISGTLRGASIGAGVGALVIVAIGETTMLYDWFWGPGPRDLQLLPPALLVVTAWSLVCGLGIGSPIGAILGTLWPGGRRSWEES